MAYDKGLAHRVEEMLADVNGLATKKMFGGLGFIVYGNMVVGVSGDLLIVRVGPDAYDEALQERNTQEFGPTGRSMIGWITVAPKGTAEDMELRRWVNMGLAFSQSLPPK